jgi:hypothetical protein
MIEHYLYLYHMCFILSELECYGVRRKMSNEKLMTKNKTYKTCFVFVFFFVGPLLFLNLITFLFFIHFKQFKVL